MTAADHDLLAAAQRLQRQDQPFALVTVLRVQPPASARPGDKAVVTAEGIVDGWIGGGCAQPVVMRTVRQALADGRARMIRIAPAEEGSTRELDDVLEFGMACHSGGTLELFVDPMLPRARLTVIGDSPLAAALAGLAPRVGLPVTVLARGADAARFPDAERVLAGDETASIAEVAPGSFVVVATQGRRDVQGLRAALSLQARQIFFVASARKAEVLRTSLVEAGHDAAAVAAIVAPAGQPIGAQTPEEIALSVLAAVVAARRGTSHADAEPSMKRPPGAMSSPTAVPDAPPVAGSGCDGEAAPAHAHAHAHAHASQTVADSCCGDRAAHAATAETGSGSCCGGGAPHADAETAAAGGGSEAVAPKG
jgi:xanthine dehydrogenase accessory factor